VDVYKIVDRGRREEKKKNGTSKPGLIVTTNALRALSMSSALANTIA